MVERVARAMFRNVGFGDCCGAEFEQDGVWENWWPKNRAYYTALARAAIEAMRPERFGDLPEAMALAGSLHAGGVGSYEEATDIFRAMIDAALGVPKEA